MDLVRGCFTVDGGLTPEAQAARGFYRPHSGFPRWRPSDDPQEVLDEALVWAAKTARIDHRAFDVLHDAAVREVARAAVNGVRAAGSLGSVPGFADL